MPTTILLSKVLGIFLVIAGIMFLLRRHYFVPVFAGFVQDRLTRTWVALAELLAGLFLVVAHNEWSSVPAGIISLFGWMAVAEGGAYLMLPDKLLERFIGVFNTPAWYGVGGLLAVAIGVNLAGHDFGVFSAGAG